MNGRKNSPGGMWRVLPGLLTLCAGMLALGLSALGTRLLILEMRPPASETQPPASVAAPDIPYAPETVIHVSPLSDGAAETLNLLYYAVAAHRSQVLLPEGTLYDDACAAMDSLAQDYPELFHLASSWNVCYYQNAPDIAAVVLLSYEMTAQEYAQARDAVSQVVQTALDGLPAGEANRAEALHDWLCARLRYGGESGSLENTAYGALMGDVSLCLGYAQALSLLLRTAGIPCGVVTGIATNPDGSSGRHAWNVAVIDGVPTLIDATWDDQSDDLIFHWYCGITDELMAIDHTPDPDQRVPVCDAMTVNWHVRRGLLVNDEAGLHAGFRALARYGAADLRFADADFFAQTVPPLNDLLHTYNEHAPEDEQFFGTYFIYPDEGQRCLFLLRAPDEESSGAP